jgi:hypothetical protein
MERDKGAVETGRERLQEFFFFFCKRNSRSQFFDGRKECLVRSDIERMYSSKKG